MPAAAASCTVATHSSKVVSPHSMPRPPPPSVRVETGRNEPKRCCCTTFSPGDADKGHDGLPRRDVQLDTATMYTHLSAGIVRLQIQGGQTCVADVSDRRPSP